MATCPYKAADAAPPHASGLPSSTTKDGGAQGRCPVDHASLGSSGKAEGNGATIGSAAAGCRHMEGPSTPPPTEGPGAAAPASPAGTCPFGFGKTGSNDSSAQANTGNAAGTDAAPAQVAGTAGAASPGVCPFGFGSTGTAPAAATANGAAAAPADAAPAVCPFGFGSAAGNTATATAYGAEHGVADGTAEAAEAAPAVCPYGFGSSSGPKMSVLHCTLCKSLLHEAHAVHGCGHIFCGACLGRFKDCPLCGRDIVGTKPATEAQGLVDTFLEAHSKDPELMAGKVDIGPTLDNSLSSFYLAIGLRSLAGGNVQAALQRLQRCKQELLQQAGQPQAGTAGEAAAAGFAEAGNAAAATATAASAAARTTESSSGGRPVSHENGATAAGSSSATSDSEAARLASRIGAVCGTLGDCYRRLGDAPAAAAAYEESCSALRRVSQSDSEVTHALSVSLNKLGDLAYLAGDVARAHGCYCQALQLRRAAVAGMKLGAFVDGGVASVLELAASLAKVGDAASALGNAEEADSRFNEARALLRRLQATDTADSLEGPLAAKLGSIWQVVGGQGQ